MSNAHKGSRLLLKDQLVAVDFSTAHFNYNQDANGIQYGNMIQPNSSCVYTITPYGKFGNGIAIEDSTTNLITSPNISTWTYWDGSGQSNIGTHTPQNDGSVYIVDNNSNTRTYIPSLVPVTTNTAYTISCKYQYVSGDSTFRYQVQGLDSSGNVVQSFWSTNYPQASGGSWQLIPFTFTFTNSSITQTRIWFQDGADYTTYTHSYYIKEAQLEQKSFATSFVNGSRSTSGSFSIPNTSIGLNVLSGTVAFWMKMGRTDSFSDMYLFTTDNWSSSNCIRMHLDNGGNLNFMYGYNLINCTASVNCPPLTWNHFAMTWDGTNLKGYFNGVNVASTTYSGTVGITSGSEFNLGTHNGNVYYGPDGTFNDLIIDQRARSAEEIMQIYISNKSLYNPFDYRAYAF